MSSRPASSRDRSDRRRSSGRPVRVAVRVNPDIDAGSHPHISTGLKINKFGVPVDAARELLGVDRQPAMADARGDPRARRVADYERRAAREPRQRSSPTGQELATRLASALEYSTSAAGSASRTTAPPGCRPQEYVAALVEEIRPTGLPIVIEPGRSIVGPAGALVAQVVDLKPRGHDRAFAVIDAGMTELLRPALYGAFHRIEAVRPRSGAGGPVRDRRTGLRKQ